MLQLRCAAFHLSHPPATHAPTRLARREQDRLASEATEMSANQLTRSAMEETMRTTKRFWRYLATPLVFAGMLGISSAAELNSAAVAYKLPDQIPWSPVDARGGQNAVVVGDPSKPGFYMVYTKWTKGNHFSRPHFHPNDRYIVVLQGTWWVGTGPKFDPANTTPMPAGSFVTHFGKQVHWDGAKDEDAVLLIMGEGPATSTAAEEK
jgi:quercetin dioxygenase-like cupin family protein